MKKEQTKHQATHLLRTESAGNKSLTSTKYTNSHGIEPYQPCHVCSILAKACLIV